MELDSIFTEVALTDAVLYKSFNNNAELTTIIVNAIKNSITIDSSYIQEQIMQIRRTKVSPLADDVLKAYQDGNIVLLYSKVAKIPQLLPFFVTRMNGGLKAFIFVNNFGTISKSAVDSSEKYLNISMKDLYVLLEGAYTSYKYALNPLKIKRSLGLMKLSCLVYTDMILRILNKEYAISNDQDLYAKISFAIGYFFLKTVWMSENEDVIFSYASNTVNSNKGINKAEFFIIADEIKNREIQNISEFIEYLREFSPKLKQLNLRYFSQVYINTFKAPSTFGLECLPYFLFIVECAMIGSFIVKQEFVIDIIRNIKGMNNFYSELTRAVS